MLKGAFIGGAYALKRLAWRRNLRRYREKLGDPLVSGRVLVRMDAGIGNAVEATPLVTAIRTLWPRIHLSILPPKGDLFGDWNLVDRVVGTPEAIAGERFDHTFVTWCVERPESHPPFEPGFVHLAEGLFPDWQLRAERELNLDPLRMIGWDGPTPPLYVSLREPAAPPPPAELRIGIAPGGKKEHRWRNKRWLHFDALVPALLDALPTAQVCVVGGPEDELTVSDDRVLDLRGRYTLRETAWLLKSCRLAIGNDCGPTHIADAVMTPTLVLFGPTCEIKNGPRYRGATLAAQAGCSPCQYDLALLDKCAKPVCMESLAVENVLERATAMLRG